MEQQANIVLLGAPGAGKGTQAAFLVQRLVIPHISTGDMLRAARAAGTELGRKAAQYMDAGELVPDDIIVGVALERLAQPGCAQGFLLDGFPRTLPQAEALTEALGQAGRRIALALNLDADEAEIVRRLSSRRVCRGCGKIFSLAKKQVQEGGACPECGGEVYQREDDQPEVIRERLAVYRRQTEPLIGYYRQQGVLRMVASIGSPDVVNDAVQAVLKETF